MALLIRLLGKTMATKNGRHFCRSVWSATATMTLSSMETPLGYIGLRCAPAADLLQQPLEGYNQVPSEREREIRSVLFGKSAFCDPLPSGEPT